ncbi:MAG: thioredoxin family protein [Desulfomonile sp.]|nr:thioredoxin family protein [Desulfomonile sp.]
MSRESRLHFAITLAVVAVFAVIVYMIFFMERPTRDSAEEQRIDLQAMTAKRVPILLEFGKGWCRPCKYMKPILEDMAKEYGERAVVAAVDMDANYDLVRRFGVRVMPTQVFLWPDGREFFRNEGVLEREDIRTVFSKMGVNGAKGGQKQSRSAAGGQATREQLPEEA